MSTSETKKAEQSVLMEVPEARKPQRQEETKSSARFSSPRPFRGWQPDQGQLLPQYAREVLGEGHLACFFVELVKVLDFSPILGAYTKECGQPPYHPVMMTLLLWEHVWMERTPEGNIRLFYVNARTVEWREFGTVDVRQLLRTCTPWDDCKLAFQRVVKSAVPPTPGMTASRWGS